MSGASFAPDLNSRLIAIDADDYRSALNCFEHEEYSEAIDILNHSIGGLKCVGDTIEVSLIELFGILGWSIVFEHDGKKLNFWQDTILHHGIHLEHTPELKVITLYELVRKNPQTVVDDCTVVLDRCRTELGKIIPKYLFVRAVAYSLLGQFDRALEDAEIAFSIFRFFQQKSWCGRTANYLGMLYRSVSCYADSLSWYVKAADYYTGIDAQHKLCMTITNIGVTKYKIADYRGALTSLNDALERGRRGNWVKRQVYSNIALGNVYRLTRDFKKARQHLHTGYNQAQKLEFPREEALALEFLGDVYRDESRTNEARRFYKRALAIAMEIAPEGDIVMEVKRRIGECLNIENEPAKAWNELLRARELAQAQGDRFEEGVILRVMAETQVTFGDVAGASEYIAEAIEVLGNIGARHELAIALMRSAEISLKSADSPETDLPLSIHLNRAWNLATKALDYFIIVDVPWWTERCRLLVDLITNRRAGLDHGNRPGSAGRRRAKNGGLIVHSSVRMRDLLRLCDIFAASSEPVLICGETGTGKELIARRVHAFSDRAPSKLVTVNVAAIPSSMFEREFFGHVRGAFSGADRDGAGFAAEADGGTLFLDEIGELPLESQPKLLRLLQDGTYQSLGDPRERYADIRLVAATNANLEQLVADGKFRSDLFYRLKILQLDVPPVRERLEDVIPLLMHFLANAAERNVELGEYFHRDSLRMLEQHDWPGNVREIAMVARQAHVQLVSTGQVSIELKREGQRSLFLFGPHLLEKQFHAAAGSPLDVSQRARILLALKETGGNRSEAAKILGMGRSTLYRHMERLGIRNKETK